MKVYNMVAAVLAVIVLSGLQSLWAQEPPAGEQAVVVVPLEQDKGPEDVLNRGTPRGSARGFIEACEEPNFEKASEYLDLSNLPADIRDIGGPELARQLYHVLTRAVWLDNYGLSDSPEGLKGDGLPGYRDLLVAIKTREGRDFELWLQRVPIGDGEFVWKLSNRSVALIPELYDEYSYPQLIERIRTWFPEGPTFLGLEAFKWIVVLVAAALAYPILWGIGWILSRLFSSPSRDVFPLVRKFFSGPFVLIGILLVVSQVIRALGAGAVARQVMEAQTLVTVAIVWALWSLTNLYRNHKQAKLDAAGRPGAAKLLRPMATVIKIVILVFGLLFWLNNLGINITTVVAGLGVGGLAVALALQKPIEDMMGALTIFTQAPMRVGDLVKYGNITGTVEDIGLRTTRLRTLNNTVVSIPNAKIAYSEVENISYRHMIRYQPTLRLRYDTTLDQLRRIRDAIWAMLAEHERVRDEPVRVRFTDFEEDAILMKVNSFIDTIDFNESLEIGEELNCRIMEIVESVGASFALPSSTVVFEGESQALQT
jgi:MscS family membrane protein